MNRVVEEVREVGKEVEVLTDAIGGDLRTRRSPRALPLERSAVAIAVAAIGWIDGAKATNRAARDGAFGNLIGGPPLAVVAHARHG